MYFKSIKHMYVQNRFLNELNQNMEIIHTRDIEVTIIAGRGLDTINYLKVKNTSDTSRSQEVVDFNTTKEGDGNALINSVFTLDGDKYVIDGAGHINILYESKSIIKSKLG